MWKTRRTSKRPSTVTGVVLGFRSGLEERIARELTDAGVAYEYEKKKIDYTSPPQPHKYTPDFVLPNGIIIETKGRFLVKDRQKHLLIKAQHPGLDIRFVFQRSKSPISKGSKTTYAAWCEKHGFAYADMHIPQSWINENDET